MATLRKIKGRYDAYFFDPARTPARKSYPLRVSQKAAAQKLLRRLERKYSEGRFDPWRPQETPGNVLAADAFDAFLESRDCRTTTMETYSVVLRQFIRTLPPNIMIAHVGPDHLRAFVATDPTVSASTRRMRYRHLRACFRWLVDSAYLEHNPLDDIKAPRKQNGIPQFLSADDLDRLLRCMDGYRVLQSCQPGPTPKVAWLKDVILVAVCTGLRISELCNLRWEDIDFDAGFLTVRNRGETFATKSGHERAVPLAGDARHAVIGGPGHPRPQLDSGDEAVCPPGAGRAGARHAGHIRWRCVTGYAYVTHKSSKPCMILQAAAVWAEGVLQKKKPRNGHFDLFRGFFRSALERTRTSTH